MAIPTDIPIIWKPTEKQSEFLACSDKEVLYGGAAGGGKSDSLLVDALGIPFNAPANKNWRAILFRRTYPELADLIDRSHDLYPLAIPGAKYNKVEHVWEAPAGGKVYFGHLQHDNDRFKYRGREFNYVGFDELTLWSTPVCWTYLKSRNRSSDRSLPTLMRATTNPDGPGQKWVMEQWGISQEGHSTRLLREVEAEVWDDQKCDWVLRTVQVARTFISAKLSDNPHLRGTGYRETLMDLPEEERQALLLGLWNGNRVQGAYYVKEMARVRQEGRICRVPWLSDVPVNTFWDLGWNDTTAIWFHQYSALSNRFPLAYENSGEKLEHYASMLQQVQQKHGIVYGTHYLPHDADNGNLQTGKSALQVLREKLPGHRFEVVPRTPDVMIGIQQTRSAFVSCWFDAEGCADGIAALDSYRKKYNKTLEVFTDTPLHDRFSNYADAFRQFALGYAPRHRGASVSGSEPDRQKRRARSSAGGWKTA